MDFDLASALNDIPQGSTFQLVNQARPPAEYLFETLLPEIGQFSYQAKSANMTVRATMAGLAAMDSPYPPVGAVEISAFSEETAKFGAGSDLSEEALRSLQQMLMQLALAQRPVNDTIVQTALNFERKVIVQAHMDTFEWLRGQALVFGLIDWTFNSKRLLVNYGIPNENFLPARAGANGYGGNASKFWDDIRLIRRVLKNNVRAIIAHPDTISMIWYNPANMVARLDAGDVNVFRFRKVNNLGQFTNDSSDVVDLIAYGLEGEVYDLANKGQTLKLPFMSTGKLLAVANNQSSNQFIIGAGSTPPPDNRLGYTHIAPTIEGGGVPGRWGRVFVPQDKPWLIRGEAVTNGLPVIEAEKKVCFSTTEMA